jgi:hypothetical protein
VYETSGGDTIGEVSGTTLITTLTLATPAIIFGLTVGRLGRPA